TLVWLAVAVTSGVVAARHQARASGLRQLLDLTESGRGYELRLAVAGQRQAVARDLHDSVAHAMTVVCLHAEAAQRRTDDRGAVGRPRRTAGLGCERGSRHPVYGCAASSEGAGTPMITVMLADDQELVRSGLRMILSAEPDLHVVAEAADGLAAVRLSRQHTP